ncbi:MAG TPA: hypothetical protein PLX79_02185 [Candidatus Dojkabacteria bacterium]|nr:hypothetical protein [Candidatus Dojkabacteria bacterium]
MKIKEILGISIIALSMLSVLSLSNPTNSYALELRRDNTTVSADEIVNDDVYIIPSENSGENVNVDGRINGDLIIFGNTVNVTGEISGNVIIFGNTITFTGNTDKSIYCAGNIINIDGTVGRDIFIAGQRAISKAEVEESAFVATYDSEIAGIIGEDLRIASNTVSIDSEIGGDLLLGAQFGSINQEKITGTKIINLGTDTKGELLDSRFAFLREEISSEQNEEQITIANKYSFENIMIAIASFVFKFVGTFALGYLIIKFFPVKTYSIVKNINGSWDNFGLSLGKGVLVMAVCVFGSTILIGLSFLGLIINFPIGQLFAPILNVAFIIAILVISVNLIFFNIAIGQVLLGLTSKALNKPSIANKSLVISLLAGQLFSSIIMLLPFAGITYYVIILLVVLGSILSVKQEQLKKANS